MYGRDGEMVALRRVGKCVVTSTNNDSLYLHLDTAKPMHNHFFFVPLNKSTHMRTDPRHGIIYGPAEHDTCAVGMGDDAKVATGRCMRAYHTRPMSYVRM